MLDTFGGALPPPPAPAERGSWGVACLRPFPVPKRSGVTAACGTCEGCRNLDRWLWSRRIAAECAAWPVSYWLTLTYGPLALRNASTKDVQRFFQRLRRGWYVRPLAESPDGELPRDARGYLLFRKARSEAERKRVGKCPGDPRLSFVWRFEHGESNGRKHVHALIHTHPDLLPPGVFPEAWPHGKVAVTIVDIERAAPLGRYLSKYTGKSSGDGFKKHASVRYGLFLSGVKR